MKSIFQSKTVALSFVTTLTGVVAAFYPPIGEWVANNSELILSGLGVVAFLLRLVTNQKVTLFPGVKALTAFLLAAAAYLRLRPLIEMRKAQDQIDEIEDQITDAGLAGTPAHKLRIEVLARRKQRCLEHLRALRSAIGDTDEG